MYDFFDVENETFWNCKIENKCEKNDEVKKSYLTIKLLK